MMNKAREMAQLAEESIILRFDQNLYNLILDRIKESAMKGYYSIRLYFNNCDYKYLEPYEIHLRQDGFRTVTSYCPPTTENQFRMVLNIEWKV